MPTWLSWLSPTMLLVIGSFVVVGLITTFVYLAFFRQAGATSDRLDELKGGPKPPPTPIRRKKPESKVGSWLKILAGDKDMKAPGQSQLAKELMAAGIRYPGAAQHFALARVVLAIVLPLMWLVIPGTKEAAGRWYYVVLIMLFGVGYIGPKFVISAKAARRSEEIQRTLPDVVDLMVVCVEAGLGLDSAIKRVGDDMAISAPILSQEFRYLSLELAAGTAREKALKNLASRTGVEEISSLVSMLIQADRFGVSIGRSLRVHSETLRVKRRQQLEEKAAKLSLKLLFPLMLFIFPAILVVIGGPAAMKIIEVFFTK